MSCMVIGVRGVRDLCSVMPLVWKLSRDQRVTLVLKAGVVENADATRTRALVRGGFN